MFKGKNILITGATGSWGNELTKQLLEKSPNKIIIFSRGELAQVTMQRKFNDPRLKFIIGDVRDADAVDSVFRLYNIDIVYHLGALKHVPVCQDQPQEAIKTNINGTTNLINAIVENRPRFNTSLFVDVSTDKAVMPSNTYGLTKAIGEHLTIQANNITPHTRFMCVRGGNVLGTNGSVVPYFVNQIKENNKITLTDGEMTRYFLTISEAIKLLLQASETGVGGETYVMKMPSFYMKDVAKAIVNKYGNKDTEIVTIGRRIGEKQHELLVSEYEASRTYILGDYYVVMPDIDIFRDYSYIKEKVSGDFKGFFSNSNVSGISEFEVLLEKGGY